MPRKKIVFFSPYHLPYTSGITMYSGTMLRELSREHEVTMLTFNHEAELQATEVVDGYRVVRIPHLFKISKGFIAPLVIPYFIRYLQTADTVVVNLPNVEGLPLVLLARLAGKNIVAIYHCQIHMSGGAATQAFNKLINYICNLQLRLATTIVGYTREYVTSTLPSNIATSQKMSLLVPPVQYHAPSEEFASKLKSQYDGCRIVGFVGRVSSEKGLLQLLHAVARAKDPKLKLVCCGPYGASVAGEARYYDQVVAEAAALGVSVDFLGRVDESQKAAFFESIDVLCLPSLSSTEAFGLVQAECMLHGTPVVASGLPGVSYCIQETGMGELATPGDVSDLSHKITRVLQNRSDYTNEAKIQKAKEVFDYAKSINEFAKLL